LRTPRRLEKPSDDALRQDSIRLIYRVEAQKSRNAAKKGVENEKNAKTATRSSPDVKPKPERVKSKRKKRKRRAAVVPGSGSR